MVADKIETLGWRGWVARSGAVLCVAVAVIGLGHVLGERAAEQAATAFPVCRSGETGDCLIAAEGRVTDTRGRSSRQRYLFEPVAPVPGAVEQSWVRLPDDGPGSEDRAVRTVVSGDPVQAHYWEREPVRFTTPEGTVVPVGAAAGDWLRGLWWSLVMLGLAVIAWYYPQNRRRTATPAVRAANGVALVAVLSGMATFLARGAVAQTVTFAATAGALVLLSVLAVWWSRLRSA